MGVRGVSRVGGVVRHSIKIKRVVLLQGEGGVVGDRGGSSGGQGEGGGPSHPGVGGARGRRGWWFTTQLVPVRRRGRLLPAAGPGAAGPTQRVVAAGRGHA